MSKIGKLGLLYLRVLGLLGIIACVQVLAQSSPRERLETFVTSAQKLASLRRGVQVMKDRKPSDPTSWFYQGAIHSVSQTAIDQAEAADPEVGNVDQKRFWNQCPHNGQNSAEFLIWHRAYIYYFERILREASGDPTLSLPYWNYTDQSQRTFPQEFANSDPDPQTGKDDPLFDRRREAAFMFGLYTLSDGAVSPDSAFNETEFFGRSETTGFAGGVWDSNARTKGRIESRPHDMLHFAIGGQIDQTAGSMSSVQTAAFDPIFWVHHANIDRLWTTWECRSPTPRTWGSVPRKAWLEAKPWEFNDVGGATVKQSRLFYLDRKNLTVSYDTDRADCNPLSSSSPSTGLSLAPGPLSISKDIKSFRIKSEAGKSQAGGRISPEGQTSVSIPVTPVGPAGALKTKVLTSKKDRPVRVFLEIENLKLEGVTSSGFNVFVNLPDGAEPSLTSPNFVGTLPLFGHQGTEGHGANHGVTTETIRFDISHLLISDPGNPSSLKLQIVPFDLLTPKPGQPRIQRPFGFTYGAVRILVMEGSTE